jgi:PAS domain S-box-containing protein
MGWAVTAPASFEAIAEAIPHIVWLADASGSTDYFNQRGTEYTGFPREANYGWRWVELVHPDDADRARVAWEHATRTATPFELTYRIRRHDGEFRWLACRALPVRDQAGEVLRWIGTADDLAELGQASDDEARRRRQAEQLQAMLQAFGPSEDARSGGVAPGPPAPRIDRGSIEVDGLGPREVAVARLIAAGHTNAEMANLLGLSLRTVEASRARLRKRLGVSTRAAIVQFARDRGLLEPAG